MKFDKSFIRKKFIIKRKKFAFTKKKFPFNLILNLIKKKYKKKNIIIAGYYHANFEVNVIDFLKIVAKKNKISIALPVIHEKNKMTFNLWKLHEPLYINNFGILEPKKNSQQVYPDIILTPLLTFDKNLNRIGYGKGYYDRALKKIKKKKKIISIGVAYSFQEYKNIPINKHDVKLNYIFTEKGILYPR